jgi:hypothetical protein
MAKTGNDNTSLVSGLRRALELWPYRFVAISIAGLAYITLNAAQ